MLSRNYVWCLMSSRVRGGGRGWNLRAPPRIMPCCTVPPWGRGDKDALCHGPPTALCHTLLPSDTCNAM